MSTLSLPRFHFAGTFKANPPTANNDDVNDFIDPTTMEVIHVPPNITNDWDFRVYLMSIKEAIIDPSQPNKFTPLVNAGWNYFGDGNTSFESTLVRSGELLNGSFIQPGDFMLNSMVNIFGNKFGDNYGAASMVDLDPAGTFNTQMFANHFQLSAITPGSPIPMITAEYPLHFQSQWLNAMRNLCRGGDTGASAMWQFCIPNSALNFNMSLMPNSKGLQDLYKAAQGGLGLMVMYCIYYIEPKISNTDLANQFQQTNYSQVIMNPTYGTLVGTIGPWYNTETQTVFNGRMLYPDQPFTYTNPCSTPKPTMQRFKSSKVPTALLEKTTDDGQLQRTVGPALLQVDDTRRVIVMDMKDTVPEVDANLAKYTLGELDLKALLPTGKTVTIGSLQYGDYDQTAYNKTAGVVEISYANSGLSTQDIYNATLQLVQPLSSGDVILLQDLPYPEIKTDARTIYMNLGDTITIPVEGWLKGITPAVGWKVQVQQYINVVTYEPPETHLISQINILPVDGQTNMPVVNLPVSQFSLDGNGQYQLPIRGIASGIAYLRFYLPGTTMPPQADPFPSWQYDFYFCVRVLPLDSTYDNIPDSQLIGEQNWNFMYQTVFRYYHLIYPAMSARIDFTSYKDCQQNASIIKQFVAEQTITSSLYMPVTRELSDGKRRLMQRWCTLNG